MAAAMGTINERTPPNPNFAEGGKERLPYGTKTEGPFPGLTTPVYCHLPDLLGGWLPHAHKFWGLECKQILHCTTRGRSEPSNRQMQDE